MEYNQAEATRLESAPLWHCFGLTKLNTQVYLKGTKTDEDREVPMNSTAREVMRKLVDQSQENGYEYLFISPKTGTRYKDIKTTWHTACRKAGIENLRIHDLRHTFGTRAADASVPLVAIGKVMGHASIQTMVRYAHATD